MVSGALMWGTISHNYSKPDYTSEPFSPVIIDDLDMSASLDRIPFSRADAKNILMHVIRIHGALLSFLNDLVSMPVRCEKFNGHVDSGCFPSVFNDRGRLNEYVALWMRQGWLVSVDRYGGGVANGQPRPLLFAHHDNTSRSLFQGEVDVYNADSSYGQSGQGRYGHSIRPDRHMLLCLQVFIGCILFALGAYGFADARYLRNKTGDFSAGIDSGIGLIAALTGGLLAVFGVLIM
jgi:hypothetical protein